MFLAAASETPTVPGPNTTRYGEHHVQDHYADMSSEDESFTELGGSSSSRKKCRMFCGLFAGFTCTALLASSVGAVIFGLVCQEGNKEPWSQALLAPSDQLSSDRSVGWWSMPVMQPMNQLLQAQQSMLKLDSRKFGDANLTFAVALARDLPNIMFATTKVQNVSELLPENLRGVFSVRGASGRRELMTMQYSRWIGERSLLLSPAAPFSYAWAAGKSTVTADGVEGILYEPAEAEARSSEEMWEKPGQSFRFSKCPQSAQFCRAGNSSLGYASVQSHPAGNALEAASPRRVPRESSLASLPLVSSALQGSVSLQELGNASWMVVEDWGVFGCPCTQRSTLTYERILDGEGKEVEPHFSDFVKEVGKEPLYVWAGWASEEQRNVSRSEFFKRLVEQRGAG